MMVRVDELQALRCSRCRAEIEIPRPLLRDPHGYAEFAEDVEREHECKVQGARFKAQGEKLRVIVMNPRVRVLRVS